MFIKFKENIDKQLRSLSSKTLFVVDSDKDAIWQAYLNGFSTPELRQEYNCNCCKQFIRNYGNIVAIDNNFQYLSVWDNWEQLPDEYKMPAKFLQDYIHSCPIRDRFLTSFRSLGTDHNFETLENKQVIRWDHFHCMLPQSYPVVSDSNIATYLGNFRSDHDVYLRSLTEITLDSAQIVLDLIQQNSLYRGEEYKSLVELFIKHKLEFESLETADRPNFAWLRSVDNPICRIRNTAIGTLLIDISEGTKSLDESVSSFERIVAPQNYKRPKALVTSSMINDAQKQVVELGLMDSLPRRHATIDDITINDVLFVDRSTKIAGNIFDELISSAVVDSKKFSKVEEVSIGDFISNVLPNSTGLELLVEQDHTPNLVTLTAPVNKDAKSLFKWDNGFGWSYNGSVADSGIKAKVKEAGGSIDGELRISLAWYNYDDLDLHMEVPSYRGKSEIYFGNKQACGGYLDVDMNACSGRSRKPVENIIFKSVMPLITTHKYAIYVHQYAERESVDVGFDVEVELFGKVYNIHSDISPNQRDKIIIGYISTLNGVTFEPASKVKVSSKNTSVWNVNTNTFVPVSLVMMSPNHWVGEQGIGNKHYMFILKDCKNPDPVRGFYNEFLRNDLTKYRKVFEVLGDKMVTPFKDNQLSGLGFSSTVRDSIIAKVKGRFERVIKIIF